MAAIASHSDRTDEHVALTGYDNTYLAALREISLTTVDPGNDAIGSLAARMLLEPHSESGEREHVAAPTLVVRESSLPHAKKA